MKGTNAYKDRMSVSTGESLFEQWCNENHYQYHRLGLQNQVNGFSKMNPILRNVPDYYVETPKGSRVVQVKGTFNIKQQEIELVNQFIDYYSSPEVPLYYAFCIKNKKPLLLPATELIGVYEESGLDKQWPDGKVYRNLNLYAEAA